MTAPELLTPEFFINHILAHFYNDIRSEIADNYDWIRFSHDGIDRSREPYAELHICTMKALLRNSEEFFMAWLLLTDENSRSLYIDLLRYRLAGHLHVKLPTNCPDYWARREDAFAQPVSTSSITVPTMFTGGLRHYEFTFENIPLRLDCGTIEWPFYQRQYFYSINGVIIAPATGDHVIDAGAGIGDTAIAFGAAVGMSGKVYLFEMLDTHLEVSNYNIAQNPDLSQFEIFACGLSDTVFTPNQASPVVGRYQPNYRLADDNQDFPTTTLDHLVTTGAISQVDFIKMDIEGSELKALHGAEATLRKFKPKLAISLYHSIEDFYEIALYLNGLDLGYQFYLGHYTIYAGETILYATVR